MAVPLSNIRQYFGGLEGVDDTTLTKHRDDAERRVVKDGVASTHQNYETLVRYAIGSSLQTGGFVSTDIGEERVADVKVKYGGGGGGGDGKETWEGAYRRVLNNIIGMTSRIGHGGT